MQIKTKKNISHAIFFEKRRLIYLHLYLIQIKIVIDTIISPRKSGAKWVLIYLVEKGNHKKYDKIIVAAMLSTPYTYEV